MPRSKPLCAYFRDYADGMLFQAAEVERERGVILNEEEFRRTRADARRRALTEFLYAGTRIPLREPMGLINRIEEAETKSLRAFYDAWYRPENMCVVIAGDIDPARTEQLVRAAFDSLAARGPAGVVPEIGTVTQSAEPMVSSHADEAGGFHISLMKVALRTKRPPTWGGKLEGLRLHTALAMLARRLEQHTQLSPSVISDSGTSVDVNFEVTRVLSVRVSSSAQDWEKALTIAEQEVRRVLEHGFTAEEVAFQQSALRQSIRGAAESFATMPSSNLADSIVGSFEEGEPLVFSNELLEEVFSAIDFISAGDCQRVFREYWGSDAPRIFITTNAENIKSPETVRASYSGSQSVPVSVAKAVETAVFAYEDFGPAGVVAKKIHRADSDVWLVRFANGVRLNIKRTPFEAGLARFQVRVGTGTVDEPADKPGLRLWAGAWWLGGVGRHTVSELGSFRDGLQGISSGIGDDAFTLHAVARSEHLPRALKQLTALVTDPAFRIEGHEMMAAHVRGMLNPLWEQPEGPVQGFILPFLVSGDHRIGVPDPEIVFKHTLDDLRAWLKPQLEKGPMEIAVVGDVDVDTVISEVAKSFGTLPTREPKTISEAERRLRVPARSSSTYYFYTGPAERPSMLEFFWPIAGKVSAAERRRLAMLALVVEDRVREQIREKQGGTYSPRARFSTSDTFIGFSFLRCTLEVRPEEAEKFGNEVRDLVDRIAKAGVKADELARVKAQYGAEVKSWMSDNLLWLDALSVAQERPEMLAAMLTAEDDVAQTSRRQLDALARKYLRADQGFRYIIDPNARMPKQ